jgi:hypothetical protein
MSFMPGRNIMEGMVMLYETIHELHKKKDEWDNSKVGLRKRL